MRKVIKTRYFHYIQRYLYKKFSPLCKFPSFLLISFKKKRYQYWNFRSFLSVKFQQLTPVIELTSVIDNKTRWRNDSDTSDSPSFFRVLTNLERQIYHKKKIL